MFSGIIEDVGSVEYLNKKKDTIGIKTKFSKFKLGESISCSGVCLTVSKINKDMFFTNLSEETLRKTNLSMLSIGDKINLEKSIKVGQEISGHFVFGHVDGLSKINKISKLSCSWLFEIEANKNIMKFLSPKCSIALDGISLTVNKVKQKSFEISIIPHTWEHTSLKLNNKGDLLNTEIDMLARYVFRALKK